MESISLDSTDLQLLNLLQTDAAQSNQSLAEQVHVSPPTCLRRVKRMHDAGLIERQVAILQPDRLAAIQGHGLACIVEGSLDRQGAEKLAAVAARAGLCAGGAHTGHAGIPGAVAAPVHGRCQCAQREGLLRNPQGEIWHKSASSA